MGKWGCRSMALEPADPYENLRRFIARPPKNAALVFATGWHVLAAALMTHMLAVVDAVEKMPTDGYELDEATKLALAELRGAVQKKSAPKPKDVEL